MPAYDAVAPELLSLRDEHALLAELLRIERVALLNFMGGAARTLARVRTQMQRRTHETEQFDAKLDRLLALYSRLLRRAASLPLPSLARLLENAVAALQAARSSTPRSGDALLPALPCIDVVFLALTAVAVRTGVPLRARRSPRSRERLAQPPATAAAPGQATGQGSQLSVALRQLAEQLAVAQGKLVQLTTVGLELVPEPQVAAFYDMLSQMLRNALEHGIESPAQRRAAGKNARGTVLVEFRRRPGGQAELYFQDDGAGLDAERIVQAAVAGGQVSGDTSLEQNRRQASALVFNAGLSTAAEPAGRGLGMRILRDNVQRLHGQIQVATKRGLFTRLRIRLAAGATGTSPAMAAQG